MTEAPQWEYRVQTFGSGLRGPKDDAVEGELNGWGEEGWEVVAVRSHENSYKMTIVAKRALTAAERRRRTLPEGSW
ncbi:MAG TPA: hypothetical protein VJJ46_05595 [Anaerolineales bacterium]|nr:hypothetical protein [Anaerolineales bacterium]